MIPFEREPHPAQEVLTSREFLYHLIC